MTNVGNIETAMIEVAIYPGREQGEQRGLSYMIWNSAERSVYEQATRPRVGNWQYGALCLARRNQILIQRAETLHAFETEIN